MAKDPRKSSPAVKPAPATEPAPAPTEEAAAVEPAPAPTEEAAAEPARHLPEWAALIHNPSNAEPAPAPVEEAAAVERLNAEDFNTTFAPFAVGSIVEYRPIVGGTEVLKAEILSEAKGVYAICIGHAMKVSGKTVTVRSRNVYNVPAANLSATK